MKIRTIKVYLELDKTNQYEWFTGIFLKNGEPYSLNHLNENGLPKVGSIINQGEILVGKYGCLEKIKSRQYYEFLILSNLTSSSIDYMNLKEEELSSLMVIELNKIYSNLYENRSFLSEFEQCLIKNAYFINENQQQTAVVELELIK